MPACGAQVRRGVVNAIQLSPFGHSRGFSGSREVHSVPGDVINDVPVE
jgi:hypothetical protein